MDKNSSELVGDIVSDLAVPLLGALERKSSCPMRTAQKQIAGSIVNLAYAHDI
jgi:hypothetical protein